MKRGDLGNNQFMQDDQSESRVFRRVGISYVRIPARDPHKTATFYQSVFGWTVDTTRPDLRFEDGNGVRNRPFRR